MQRPAFVRERVALAPMTTFELGGPAQFFVDAEDEDTLVAALRWARERGIACKILAGGSNTLVRDEGVEGLVLRVRTRGERVEVLDRSRVRVSVAAGEPWDEFVGRCVQRRWAGLECLSGVPGTVGATPIQNVGAYGQDVSETIERVRVWDLVTCEARWVSAEQCRFAYRDSAFKHRHDPLASSVVLEVSFALRVDGAPCVRYAELRAALQREGVGDASLEDVRRAVLALRASKSMVLSPADENRRSAGSFFKNPILTAEAFAALSGRARAEREGASVPHWVEPDGRVKVSAAWLIERSGFAKGTRRGPVGISTKHALALVHHGDGSTRALLALADEIAHKVWRAWQVSLEREPVLW